MTQLKELICQEFWKNQRASEANQFTLTVVVSNVRVSTKTQEDFGIVSIR